MAIDKSLLKEITNEQANKLFPNYGIYFENEKGEIEFRCWWDYVESWHNFPISKKYYLNKNSPALI
jgi:hypothetical protein